MQKFADAPLTAHEKCGGGPVQRLLSVPALQFKGTGFYITDYTKSGGDSGKNGDSKKSESGESSSTKETSRAKTESTASPAKSSDSSGASTTSKPVSDKK